MGVVISGWLGMPFPLPGVLSALILGLWTFFFFFFKDYSLSTDLLHGSRGCEFLWTLDVVIEWAFA